MHDPCHSFQSSSHCGKCGRRSRHPIPFKCKREHHLFPSTPSTYPAISQNTSYPSPKTDVLIDQFIQVQQIDPRKCYSSSHQVKNEYRSKSDRTTSKKEKEHFQRWHRARQMIYLRENINKYSCRTTECLEEEKKHEGFRFSSLFRLIPLSSEYVIVKRLEESNHLHQHNRINVDHLFRPFEMQYQTMSQELKKIIIPTTIYQREVTKLDSSTILTSSMNNNYSQSRPVHFSSLQNTNDLRTAPFDQTSSETNSPSSSSSATSNTKRQISLKYAETFEKMKRLLELLRLHLMNKSNLVKTMTSDSLQSTSSNHSIYSVSSALAISSENKISDRYKSSSISQSTINVEDEITPIDEHVPFRQHRSEIRIRNRAQNINQNQKNIDDNYEDIEDVIRISETTKPMAYMPSSFMFILQILLLSCLLNRLFIPSDMNAFDLLMNNVSSSVIT